VGPSFFRKSENGTKHTKGWEPLLRTLFKLSLGLANEVKLLEDLLKL
jgi:hypothetical protein